MLNPIQQAWVDGLRSGDYKQGNGQLTTIKPDGTEEDCCLGVACKLAVKAGVEIDVRITPAWARQDGHVSYDGCSGLPSQKVLDWLGLKDCNGSFTIPSRGTDEYRCDLSRTSLATENDLGHKTFKQIANFIESHADELFVSA